MKLHFLFDDEATCFDEMSTSIDKLPSINLLVVPRKGEYIQVTDEQIDLMVEAGILFSDEEVTKLKSLCIHKVKDVFYTEQFILLLLEVDI